MYHSKLFQEPYIVFIQNPNVVYIIAEKRSAFDTHAECIAGIFLRIISNRLKHMRMNHAGAENFQPAGMFANAASFASANEAGNIHLCAWFCEWEETWTESVLDRTSVELFCERNKCSLQLAECYAAVHI